MPTLYPQVMGRQAMIATEHYLSAAAGARIFARGGNHVDAAVAAALVEGIVNPHMHTIGGEAPMLIYTAATKRVVAINGNTAAPARATIAEFRARGLDLVPGQGLLAAGPPAAPGAFLHALEHFGTRSLAEVAEPALQLCTNGFPMHAGLSGLSSSSDEPGNMAAAGTSISGNAEKFATRWPSSARVYKPNGRVPRPADIIDNPALADFFRRLLDSEASAAHSGREAGLRAAADRFYRGDIARDIVAHSDAHGGLLALEDLAAFTTRTETPITAGYRGVSVFKCAPWSQGPVFLQQLRILEGFDLRKMGHNSADYIHTVVEAAKLAFAAREAFYGDPEFIDVPLDGLLSDSYTALRRALVDPAHASLDYRPGDPRTPRALGEPLAHARSWGGGTVHVTAADGAGNMIAITPSGGWIPSSPVIDALGFPLGTRLQTFYLDERHPNALVPRKRPRTTLTPSLATRGGDPYLAFGTPGGDQQDQWTLQFFLNVVDFGMNLQEAIEAPRFSSGHFPSSFYPHAARPGYLAAESRIDPNVRESLAARGHLVDTRPPWCEGYVLAVSVDPKRGLLYGGADPRGQAASVMAAQVIGW